jgi:hypothetical protein
MKTCSPRSVWALRQLLKRKFEDAMSNISAQKFFQHTFSKAEPKFRLTLEVDAFEFAELVLERDVSMLNTKLKRLQQRYDALKAKYEPEAPKEIIEDDPEPDYNG